MPEYCRPYLVEGRNGYSFNQNIKDSIVFEYHDVLNHHQFPNLDIILVRDTLSFFTSDQQDQLINEFDEKLKNRGLIILGRNEALSGGIWQSVGRDPVSAFTHNK
jgi:purine-binding chemotaxis protein CheW